MLGRCLMVRLATAVNRGMLPILLAITVACGGNGGTPEADVAAPPYLTIFLIDGMVQDVFARELSAGRLPNIDGLVRDGTIIENGISSFPSMTGFGFYPFITGEDAAASGVLGLRFLDRSRATGLFRNYVGRTYKQMNEDLKAEPRTIFEELAGPSQTYNSYVNRGASEKVMAGIRFTLAKYRDAWWLGRLLSGLPSSLSPTFADVESELTDLAIERLDTKPKVQWITYTSPDGYAHVHGVTDSYADRLHEIDALIGRYRDAARTKGIEADRIYAVLTDHGLAQVNVNLDLRTAMAERMALKMFRGDATELGTTLETTLADFADVDGVLATNGNTMCHVYLRRAAEGFARPYTSTELRAFEVPTASQQATTVDVIDGLTRLHGIELVVARGNLGTLAVFGAEGEGTITIAGDAYAYAARGNDPLGYADTPATAALMDGQPHPAAQWLKASTDGSFPDALHRLAVLFADANTGDVVVTAIPGYDLVSDYEMIVGAYRGGHGGLRADQLRVPYVLSGAGVHRRGHIEVARAEDVGATLRVLLGLTASATSGGKVIDGALR